MELLIKAVSALASTDCIVEVARYSSAVTMSDFSMPVGYQDRQVRLGTLKMGHQCDSFPLFLLQNDYLLSRACASVSTQQPENWPSYDEVM